MKKVGKTTRPFRCDLNQIPYDYTVEVRKRFKGLGLIDRVPEDLWTEVSDIVQDAGIKTIPMGKKKCKQVKWLSEEALQIAVKREAKSKGEKERYKYYLCICMQKFSTMFNKGLRENIKRSDVEIGKHKLNEMGAPNMKSEK